MRYGPDGIPGSPLPAYTEHRHSSVGVGNSTTPYIKGELPVPLATKSSEKYLTDSDGTLIIYHSAYLASVTNTLDLMVVIAYWIDFALMHYEYPWCSFFKGIAAMKCLNLLYITEGTSVIMRSLSECSDLLRNALFIFFFFWVLFSLIGLFVFLGNFARRCVVYDGGDPAEYEVVEPELFCSGYYYENPLDGSIHRQGPYDIVTQAFLQRGTGFFCKVGQFCVQEKSLAPEWTYLSFFNIYYAMLNVFTVISIEDWSYMMYDTQDGTSTIGSPVFFCLCVYFMTFIMAPLFVAVITTSFSRIRGESKSSAFAARKQKTRQLQTDEKGGQWKITTNDEMENQPEIRLICHYIVSSKYFFLLGHLVVAMYLLAMMVRSKRQALWTLSTEHTKWGKPSIPDTLEITFTLILLFEIILRFFGMRAILFDSCARNIIDLTIAVSTSIILIPVIRYSSAFRYLTVFQVARAYRIVYLLPPVYRLMENVLGDGEGVLNLSFFTFLVLFLLCPVAMQLFGGDFDVVALTDEPVMRFDNFYQSFLSLFQILTGEDWTVILYGAMQSQANLSTVYAGIFIVFFYFVGHYVVLNLFIAIVMENFDMDEDEIRMLQIKKYIKENQSQPKKLEMDMIGRLILPLCRAKEKKPLSMTKLPPDLLFNTPQTDFFQFLDASNSNEYSTNKSHGQRPPPYLSWETRKSAETQVPEDDFTANLEKEYKDIADENQSKVRTLIFFAENSKIRHVCRRIVGSSSDPEAEKKNLYNWFIFTCIVVSVILMAIDDPVLRFEQRPLISYDDFFVVEVILLAIFVIDILIRIIADGLLVLPTSYLRNNWNVFDLIVVLIQVVAMFVPLIGSGRAVPLIESMRGLRLFRIVRYFEGMRLMFLDLLHGIPSIICAGALMLVMYIPFALYAVNIFGGRFYLCNDGDVEGVEECYGEFVEVDSQSIYQPRVWANPYGYSFDSFGVSLLHLIQIASGEGWISSLFSAMSVPPELGVQPQFDWYYEKIWYSLYYIAFMFLGSIFILQLFIGVILENFKQRSGISSLTSAQRQFNDIQRRLGYIKPSRLAIRPKSKIRRLCFHLVIDKHGNYSTFMSGTVVFNIPLAFRLVQRSPVLHELFRTVQLSIPSIINVSAVFALTLLCFAIIFNQFFALVRFGPNGTVHANFRDIGTSLQTLFRMTTGEDWNALLHDYAVGYPNCVEMGSFYVDCGYPVISYFFFLMFYFICTYIFVNLLTVVVINNFSYAFDKRNASNLITEEDLRLFKVAWSTLDPTATGYIQQKEIGRFLHILEGKLGIRIYPKHLSIPALLEKSRRPWNCPNQERKTTSQKMLSNFYKKLSISHFNTEEVAKALSTMDLNAVREARRTYDFKYKELQSCVGPRGLPFSVALRALALSLVDIAQSLNLDDLVEQASHEAVIKDAVALEKARGVFLTTIQHRRFLQWQESNRAKEMEAIKFDDLDDLNLSPGLVDLKQPKQFLPTGTHSIICLLEIPYH
ncbi:Ion transport protein-domain-containing protein [Umbelopsis sp. PMI_123]|nr:Ion transport protein-domain-containing protein [Umbelopsis sp. PMI_123]